MAKTYKKEPTNKKSKNKPLQKDTYKKSKKSFLQNSEKLYHDHS